MKILQVGAVTILVLMLLMTNTPTIFAQEPILNWFKPAVNDHNTNFHPQDAINRDNVGNLVLRDYPFLVFFLPMS